MNITRYGSGAFLSDVVAAGGIVWISGMVAGAKSQHSDTAIQMRDILDQLDARLHLAGGDRTHLTSVSIWLADIGDWAAMNDVWIEWLNGAPPPTRATVQAGLVPPYRIEIAAVAAVGAL